jgi:4-amino-4-deoxy-L-arabinose transferase-like glycosyltransferase
VARVAWAAWVAHAHPEAVVSPDTQGYLGPARALLEEGRFTLAPDDPTPMLLRTPGYPLLLAAVLGVTDSEWSLSPIQAALSGVIVLVVIAIGRRVASPAVGLVAGLLVAFSPLQFAFSGTILSESAATLALVLVAAAGIPLFARPVEDARWTHALVLGLALAVATMVKPTTYYLPLLLAVLLAIRFWKVGATRTLAVVVAFVLPSVLIVGGWQVRNQREVGTSQIAGTAPVAMYCWNAADALARAEGSSIREVRADLGCSLGGWDDMATACPSFFECDEHPLDDGDGWDEMQSRALEILRDHPVETVEVGLRGLAREVAGPGTENVRRFLHVRSTPILPAALFAWNAALWVFAAIGLYAGLRSARAWYWVFVTSLIGYVLLVSAGANAGARFRVPVIPLVALLAAVGVRHVARSVRARRAGRDAAPATPEAAAAS